MKKTHEKKVTIKAPEAPGAKPAVVPGAKPAVVVHTKHTAKKAPKK